MRLTGVLVDRQRLWYILNRPSFEKLRKDCRASDASEREDIDTFTEVTGIKAGHERTVCFLRLSQLSGIPPSTADVRHMARCAPHCTTQRYTSCFLKVHVIGHAVAISSTCNRFHTRLSRLVVAVIPYLGTVHTVDPTSIER